MRVLITLFATATIMFICESTWAQCDAEKDTAICIKMENEGYHFVKSYKLDGQSNPGIIEVSSVFAKNTEYYISNCESGRISEDILVTIYNAKRKKVISNNENGKLTPSLTFNCNDTGVYYITYAHQKAEQYCGLSAVSFKRDESQN